jgi:hypothetical protein
MSDGFKKEYLERGILKNELRRMGIDNRGNPPQRLHCDSQTTGKVELKGEFGYFT